jgi:ribose 5-phosphate isomerase B
LIRRLGSHSGRRVVFGYDRYLAPDLTQYRGLLLSHGSVIEAVDSERLHYLNSAEIACRAIQEEPNSFGILVCGTGMGMSIAANKFRGIYAARCTSVDDAELARTINNANVLCLAAKMGFAHNAAIVEAFIRTPYTGRKLEELEYITEIEDASASAGAHSSTIRRTA